MLWQSAIFDFFRKYCKINSVLDIEIPVSMLEWKEEILDGNNVLGEWVMENIIETDKPEDFVTLAELHTLYNNDNNSVAQKTFINNVKEFLRQKNIEVIKKHSYKDVKRIQKRNCVKGFKKVSSNLMKNGN